MKDKSLKKLILKARDGDNNSFDELVRKIKNKLFRIAKARLLNNEDASDAVQECIISIYSNLPKLKKINNFNTWVITILINKCNNIYNEKTKFRNVVFNEEIGVDFTYTIAGERNYLDDLFISLDDDERMILTLFYIEKYTSKEISKILDMNMNTVKTKILRSRRKLKEKLQNRGEED